MAAGQIDIFGKFHASTAEGILAVTSEIKDEHFNKTQAELNLEFSENHGGVSSVAGLTGDVLAADLLEALNLDDVVSNVSVLMQRTNWDNYFGIDQETGAIFVKPIDENTPRGFYSIGYVSAGGVGSSQGGGGADLLDMWVSLRDNTPNEDFYNWKINAGHLPLGSGLTVDANGNINVGTAGSVAWTNVTGKPTTVSGYGITDAVTNASYNSTTKRIELKCGNVVISYIDATAFIKDGMVSNVQVTGGNLVISFNTEAGQEDIRIPISDIFNADNYYDKTASDARFFLAANFTAANIVSTIGNTPVARASRLDGDTALSIWGVEYWANGVPKTVSARPGLYVAGTQVNINANKDTLLGVTAISNGLSSGSSDESRIEWDATNHAWHFYGGIYADTFVTAGGTNASGGGGGGADLQSVWLSLKTNEDEFANEKINVAHIPSLPWSIIGSGKPTTIGGYGITDAYTKNQVDSLIGSINQFHYEIYPSTGSVSNPRSNVLYLIGPIGTGSDKYEEYVYPNAETGWVKIGETTIDLAPYLTIASAQATYQPIISDLATIRSRANEGHTIYGYFTNGVLDLEHVPLDDKLSYVDPDAGEEITIDDPGTTGTVLWGAESANVVSLDVNGVSKILVKQAALDGINSNISSLRAIVATKQDYISDLSSIRSNASLGATAHSWGDHRLEGYLKSVPTASASTLGLVKIGQGLAIDGSGVVSVTGQTQGTVTRVDIGSTQYSPDANGVVGLPAYPTTLPASDVYAWAKEATKPSYAFSEITGTAAESQIPSLPYTKITGLGTAATRGVASTIGASITNLIPGSLLYNVLGDAFDSSNTVVAFVNSSIATATATFRGTNDDATTEAAFLAWANSLTHDLNDYVFWRTVDSVGNVVYKRYKYNGSSWAFEYDLNNSSFTAAQWSAINSGITSTLVAAFNAKYDKPIGGIPKTDLASAVQTSLGLADTALQAHQAIYGLTINNSAGTAVLSYNPKTAAGSLTLTKAMVGLGNVENFVYVIPTGAEQTYTYPV